MATITVNNQDVTLDDAEDLNVIEAADRAGVKIPYYCWHPGLSVVASCRMCLVEVGQRSQDGAVQMIPRLVPACQTPAKEGTVVVTDSEKVLENRRAVEEYLLLDHPVDCPICDRAGECHLQDYYFEHGREERRDLPQPFTSRRKDLGPEVAFFVDRCVMCSRCVRFTREVSGTAELQIVDRGHNSEIDIFPGFPIDNKLSGNVVDLCPVGALCSRDFLYQQRVWFLKQSDSICTGCSTGCSIRIDHNRGQVHRLKPRHNPDINQWWMCDEGRLGFHYIHSDSRLTEPRVKQGDQVEVVEWDAAYHRVRSAVERGVDEFGSDAIALVLSPMIACEEAYLALEWFRSCSPDAPCFLGPVPIEGEDDHYPKTQNGSDVGLPQFTIRAEKCPNRHGVQQVITGLTESSHSFATFMERVDSGLIKVAVVVGSYPDVWLDDATVEQLSQLDHLTVVDLLDSRITKNADVVLPAASWAEKSGAYVNALEILQVTERAILPAGESRSEGRIFWDLARRERLYHQGDVLAELSRSVNYFKPVADLDSGKVAGTGCQLGSGSASAVEEHVNRGDA